MNFLKEHRIELALVTALCCVYNIYTANMVLAVVCGVAAVANYILALEDK